MKILKIILVCCFLSIFYSCGICFPANLEFKNIKYFSSETLKDIDLNSEYRQTAVYEATRDLKRIINEPREPNKISIKIKQNGFIEANLWPLNYKNEQGIIYSKNGKLFIDKIGSDQDRCKFIETYRVKLDKNKIILIEYGGITNQKNVFEYTKIE